MGKIIEETSITYRQPVLPSGGIAETQKTFICQEEKLLNMRRITNHCTLSEEAIFATDASVFRTSGLLVVVTSCPSVVARWNPSEGGDRGGLETRVASVIFGA